MQLPSVDTYHSIPESTVIRTEPASFRSVSSAIKHIAEQLKQQDLSGVDSVCVLWPAANAYSKEEIDLYNSLAFYGFESTLALALSVLWKYRDLLPEEFLVQPETDLIQLDLVDPNTGETTKSPYAWFLRPDVQNFAAEVMLRRGKKKPKLKGAELIADDTVADSLFVLKEISDVFAKSTSRTQNSGKLHTVVASLGTFPGNGLHDEYPDRYAKFFEILGAPNAFGVAKDFVVNYFDDRITALVDYKIHLDQLMMQLTNDLRYATTLAIPIVNSDLLFLENFLASHPGKLSVEYSECGYDAALYLFANVLLDASLTEDNKPRSLVEVFSHEELNRFVIKHYLAFVGMIAGYRQKRKLTEKEVWEFACGIVDPLTQQQVQAIIVAQEKAPLLAALQNVISIDLAAYENDFLTPES